MEGSGAPWTSVNHKPESARTEKSNTRQTQLRALAVSPALDKTKHKAPLTLHLKPLNLEICALHPINPQAKPLGDENGVLELSLHRAEQTAEDSEQ